VNSDTRKKVAFVLPVVGGVFYEIYQYVKHRLEEEIPDIYILPVPGGAVDSMQLHTALDGIINGGFDLFFILSVGTTSIAKKKLEESKIKVPFLFFGNPYPKESGVLQNLEAPEGYCTGVIHPLQDMGAFSQFFYDCFSGIKRILLVSHNSSIFVRSIVKLSNKKLQSVGDFPEEIRIFFAQKNIPVTILNETDENKLFRSFSQEVKNHEAVFLLEGSRTIAWSKEIFQICQKNNVVLYNGHVQDVKNGFSHLGYGMDYTPVSEALVQQAIKILRDNEKIKNIPVVDLENNRFSCANKNVFQLASFKSADLNEAFRKWNTTVYED